MNQTRVITAVVLAALIGMSVWIARNTYWDWTSEVTPPRGEAAEDPYYSLVRFAQGLGLETREVPSLETLPPVNAVLIYGYSAAGTGTAERLEALEQWVAAGGRLLVPSTALFASKPLQAWSRIVSPKPAAHKAATPPTAPPKPVLTGSSTVAFVRLPDCVLYAVEAGGLDAGETLSECDAGGPLEYQGKGPPLWSLGASAGLHALRVGIGRGTLAVVDREFVYENQGLLKGDHARLLVALVPLRRGDTLWIVNTRSAEPLPRLLWRVGAPAILALLLAVAFAIWRNWPRFGPIVPVPLPARRSLAEQLRAHARFAARTGRLGALRRAAVRALEEVARRRVPGYANLSSVERARALALPGGESAELIAAALAERPDAGPRAEGAAILLLARARRALLHLSPNRRWRA
jgi:hypothetical protein